jgi:hypothetical protein
MRVGRGLTIWVLCATGTLAGCGAPGDMFTAHPPLAATAGPTGLPADRLAELLTGLGKQVSLNKAGAELLAPRSMTRPLPRRRCGRRWFGRG